MSLLTVSDIYKTHGDHVVVDHVSFNQERGQRIAIAGETGSGKTSLVRIIAGLGQTDSGEVLFEGKPVKGVNEKLMPGHPGIVYLSQYFELNNNYRVEEVLEYGSRLSPAEEEGLCRVCDITHLRKRVTNTLSGGEKQRVALARLLGQKPRLLLLDEPFSNMDLPHKNLLKRVIDDVGQQLNITCIMISHDASDLLPWADEVLVMRGGRIVQQGPPEEVYKHPVSEYVAGMFGKYNNFSLALMLALKGGMRMNKFIRPEDIVLVPDEFSGVRGRVRNMYFYGGYYELEVQVENDLLIVKTDNRNIRQGDTVYINLRW